MLIFPQMHSGKNVVKYSDCLITVAAAVLKAKLCCADYWNFLLAANWMSA